MRKDTLVYLLLIAFALATLNSACQSQTKNEPGKTTTTDTLKTKNMSTTKEIIIDVRSPDEWEFDGHADCSVNYPLDEISSRIDELKKYEHIVLVCRSGNRAGIAKRVLEGAGIQNVENLGPWQNITCAN